MCKGSFLGFFYFCLLLYINLAMIIMDSLSMQADLEQFFEIYTME